MVCKQIAISPYNKFDAALSGREDFAYEIPAYGPCAIACMNKSPVAQHDEEISLMSRFAGKCPPLFGIPRVLIIAFLQLSGIPNQNCSARVSSAKQLIIDWAVVCEGFCNVL